MTTYTAEQQETYDRTFAMLRNLGFGEVVAANAARGKAEGFEIPPPRFAPERDDDRADYADVALVRGDTIAPEPVRWIWDGWLAAGKFHVLAGQPGTGKTTLAEAIAATLTIGGRWPDGTRADVGDVLIWSGEDDPADTLIPRLIAMDADMKRVHFVGNVRNDVEVRPFDPAHDVPVLVLAAARLGNVKLLVVDPVVSAVAADSHKNAETRRSLQPLVNLAATLQCAVLGITHLSKGTSGREPIERVTGSLAFGALARVVLVTAKLPADDDDRPGERVLIRAKSNIGVDHGGYKYELVQRELPSHPGISASSVQWGSAIEGTARELLAEAETVPDDVHVDGARGDAREWLLELLKGRVVDGKQVKELARQSGISHATLHRAADEIETLRRLSGGFGKPRLWHICIADPCHVCHVSQLKNNDTDGNVDTDGESADAMCIKSPMCIKLSERGNSDTDGTHGAVEETF